MPADVRARNRALLLAHGFLAALARSIWGGDILSAYIFLAHGTARDVGVASGVRGLSQLALAPLGGWLADALPRGVALRLGCGLALCGSGALAYAVATRSMPALLVAMLLWGAHFAAAVPASDALFADSVDAGERSRWFTRRYQLTQLAGAAGPLLWAALLAYAGNEWRAGACAVVLLVGCAMAAPASLLLLCARDVRASQLPPPPPPVARRGGEVHAPKPGRAMPPPPAAEARLELHAPLLAAAPASAPATRARTACAELRAQGTCCSGRLLLVPCAVLCYDVLSALASGLSVRFLPLWLLQDMHLAPVAVGLLSAAVMAGIAAAGGGAQRLGVALGRADATAACRAAGVLAFVGMAAGSQLLAPAPLVLACYYARMLLVNCAFGLTKSIIHDCVPPPQRARYAAIDTVNQATWAGSAAAGGLIFDRWGACAAFYATAAAQMLALAPLCAVRSRVPREATRSGQASGSSR